MLRVPAKADRAGSHVFRGEVICQPLEIKLAADEITRFYGAEPPVAVAEAPGDSKKDVRAPASGGVHPRRPPAAVGSGDFFCPY